VGKPIIKIENLSKQYRLGLVSTRTISHDLNRWWQINIRGKEDPYLKIGETNDRASKGESEYVWALKDINLEIEEGEVLGIIGKNGAGKSTLLKILSKVTAPSTGIIKAKGRIASLLEVGTGFHQEMTGRENIYLNGAILGMTKTEINHKFDEIVDFAGVERYIDTPVKRYSSGMIVRLGFAVAAHLEPEILIVDEVLAVGDAEFQKKALGKMQDVSRDEGRTVLFVSHSMGSISRLCNKGVLLKNGSIHIIGTTDEVVEKYIGENSSIEPLYKTENDGLKKTQILSIRIFNETGKITDTFSICENLNLEVVIKNISEEKGIRCNIGLWDYYGNLIMIERIKIIKISDSVILRGELLGNLLLPNKYRLSISLDIPNVRVIELLPFDFSFGIVDNIGIEVSKNGDKENGVIKSYWRWS
jgi:lipopolysaccharide transport system ATP-binding protein